MSEKLKKPQILLVDDTTTNLHLLGALLQPEYRLKVATSGAAALELLANAENRPDLILLDVMMTAMDGYTLCRLLKEQPQTREIPIIFITAKSSTPDEEYGLRLGAVDYIGKPFHPAIVLARVRNHILLKQRTDLLEQLALLDGLTHIANRRRFDQRLAEEWRRCQREGHPLSLLMIDVDHFKAFNDYFGHADGDRALEQVAAVMAAEMERAGDLLARYGGEEFVALLPGVEPEGAKVVAERLRSAVAALAIPHADSIGGVLTLSVGVAGMVPDLPGSSDELQALADRALYAAKSGGRNRVVVAAGSEELWPGN